MQRRTLHPNSLGMPHPLKRGDAGCPGTGGLVAEAGPASVDRCLEGRAASSAARPSKQRSSGGEQGHLLRSSTGCEVTPAASDRFPPRGTHHRLLK
jgi:hypothetical protein